MAIDSQTNVDYLNQRLLSFYLEAKEKESSNNSIKTKEKISVVFSENVENIDFIPVPRSKPIEIPKLDMKSVAVEDQIPHKRMEPQQSSHPFSGYD